MDAQLRAADSDRRQVIDALHQHTIAGRLSLDEFTGRLDAVHHARTYQDLAAVTADLPTPASRPPADHRAAVTTVAVTAVLLVVLLAAAALAATAGWGHLDTMMTSTTTAADTSAGIRKFGPASTALMARALRQMCAHHRRGDGTDRMKRL
jgi:hypothetical protein